MTIEEAVAFAKALMWYGYNVDEAQIILDTYGKVTKEYAKEKAQYLKIGGILGLYAAVDPTHRERIIKAVAKRYPDLVKIQN
jgi:hypothetical protein